MKKDGKQRLFEVMSRLDKTFPKLNEDFEEIEATSDVDVPAEMGATEVPVEEKSPEEKLQELTAKVDELYALIHNEDAGEKPAEELPIEPEVGEELPNVENLQEWNFDKKKGDDKEEKKDDKSAEPKKEEVDEAEEKELSKKIPVVGVAKVGEAK